MSRPVSEVKVLVVDDQPVIVEQLSEFLETKGYVCVTAQSTDEAIKHYVSDPAIGLLICDLHMPDRDGIELMRALKEINGNQRIFEAIMLTGRAEKQDVIRALREGFADYYQKPMDLDELLAGVRRQEEALLSRLRSVRDLGGLNQRLQDLADSVDELYQDLEKARGQGTHRRATDAAESEWELPP
ncbi:MAG: response regulator, partial [Pseudomonas putida]